MPILQDLLNKARGTQRKKQEKTAAEAFRRWGSEIRTKAPSRDKMGNQIMSDYKSNLTGRISYNHIGKMVMFFYDAKWKGTKQLPYWDRFPLVVPIELYNDGFLGLNLHYLAPRHRAVLLDNLITLTGQQTSAKAQVQLTYQFLKSNAKSNRLYIPCIKRYLYVPHMKSRFFVVPRNLWYVSLFLPLERFEGANRQRVYNESLQKSR